MFPVYSPFQHFRWQPLKNRQSQRTVASLLQNAGALIQISRSSIPMTLQSRLLQRWEKWCLIQIRNQPTSLKIPKGKKRTFRGQCFTTSAKSSQLCLYLELGRGSVPCAPKALHEFVNTWKRTTSTSTLKTGKLLKSTAMRLHC